MQALVNPAKTDTNAQTAASISSPPAPVPGPSVSTGPYTSQFSVQSQTPSRPYYTHPGANTYTAGYPASPPHPGAPSRQTGSQPSAGVHYPPHTNYQPQHPPAQGVPQASTGTYSYYNYHPSAWSNAWNTGSYQYGAGGSYPYPYAQPASAPPAPHAVAPMHQHKHAAQPPPPAKRKTPTPSPSPSPPPEYHKDWDAVIKSFLSAIGFSQAAKGFEADMLILNPDFERNKVPAALGELMKDLLNLGQSRPETGDTSTQDRPLEERKLDYTHLANGATPRSQTSITKDISQFLAQNRARNDASNRNEFLLSVAEKRRRLNENGDSEPAPSCARTDAKTQNRDLQMKYDIAKNEDGPLRRTLKSGVPGNPASTPSTSKVGANSAAEDMPSAGRYPALDERLQNIERHLAIRYVPLPPRSLLDRLKYLEDHVIHLEKEYPPWAALHFNQPNRGWPPPPRPTPIIVPSHLTSTTAREPTELATSSIAPGSSSTPAGHSTPVTETADPKGKAKPGRHTKSSLHRAVMERLEVQKAINDLTGEGG
ncbi:uncharacterized protein TRAVEDRAFT_115068 [Trametes versicolor FP-101664 SS1]|uniref:uncharacterized protein n=1 Tax=Trametes versicolor (strain FP-101664) TaxID=717944 RepID=UPI0004622624|nr:uncharacterized protein TRAVEDRAFT_115068 [Trametes versicolor FP-101664 SS1]EIW62634.1 hypothetical protein TRAVEDRAFT_115068 [Trametes versicolor FP-101664 SS1]